MRDAYNAGSSMLQSQNITEVTRLQENKSRMQQVKNREAVHRKEIENKKSNCEIYLSYQEIIIYLSYQEIRDKRYLPHPKPLLQVKQSQFSYLTNIYNPI